MAQVRQGLRVLAQAARHEPRILGIAVAGAVVTGVTTVAGAHIVGDVAGRVVIPALELGTAEAATVVLAAAALVGVSLIKVAGIFARRLGAGYAQYRMQARFRRLVAERYLELPIAWHQRHPTGTLLSIVGSDVDLLWAPILSLPLALGTVVMLVTAIVSILLVDWPLALVATAVLPLVYGLYGVYSRRMVPRMAVAQRVRADVSAIAHESIDGALVVKAMGRQEHETARFTAKLAELRDALIAVGRVRGFFEPMLDAIPSLGTLVILLVGAWRLSQGAIDVSALIGVAFLLTLFDMPLRAIGWVLADLPRTVAGWQRVQGVLTAEGGMSYGDTVLDTGGGAALRFDTVGFAYDARYPVLRDVTFEVAPGQVVAVVGATGAGKSTVASLAARVVDPASGAVRIDGHPAPDIAAGSLAATVSFVPQLAFLFDDTVRGNVALGRAGITDDDVWAALRAARADGFVTRLAAGLDTPLGERGTTLSGGQRQRLALARALAGRPRLLVLDEATSAVDPLVESEILGGLRTGGRSILLVAHRPGTLRLADRVVYLDGGAVAATGTHDELMAASPGYAEVVTAYEREQVRA